MHFYVLTQDLRTALSWAAGEEHVEVVKALMTAGANAEARDKVQYFYVSICTSPFIPPLLL